MNNYTYDGEGMLTAAGSAQYTYDALQQQVEKTGGSNPEGMIYFNGWPVALYNPSGGVRAVLRSKILSGPCVSPLGTVGSRDKALLRCCVVSICYTRGSRPVAGGP